MGDRKKPELLLLHALPLDGTMWAGQLGLLPGATYAPTLTDLGESVEEWASAVLNRAKSDRLIVVGCSVGGSCALEIAHAAPDRVAALVLIGTKAAHRPEPELHAAAMRTLRGQGLAAAWQRYWGPLFSATADARVVAEARRLALAQRPEAVARGVTAFHTRPSRGEALSRAAHPVVVVTGAEDIAPGPKISAMQATAAPRGQLHVVPGSGHYVPLERPAELNAILSAVIAAEHRQPVRA